MSLDASHPWTVTEPRPLRYCTAFIGGAPINLPKGAVLSVGNTTKSDPICQVIQHAVIDKFRIAVPDAIEPSPSLKSTESRCHCLLDSDAIISVLSLGHDAWQLLYRPGKRPDEIVLLLRSDVATLMPPGALIATTLIVQLRESVDAHGYLWINFRDCLAKSLKHRKLKRLTLQSRYLWF